MKLSPASSRQLSVLAIELQADLEQSSLFAQINVRKTGMLECALVITCSLVDNSTPQRQIAQLLERILDDPSVIRGDERNNYKITMPVGKVEMQFATLIDSARATGRIEVAGFD